jgi:TonB-linked SusC/RagA family outer membrane protein
MKTKLLMQIVCCIWLCTQTFYAAGQDRNQERMVTGIVSANDKGEPLDGVSIIVKGTSIMTQTAPNGWFSIKMPRAAKVLTFTHVGYGSMDFPVGEEKKEVKVILSPAAKELTDVVVSSGYATQSKRDFTGSASQINSSKLENKPAQSFTQLLGGQAAGVDIVQPTSSLNNPPVLRIRGINSISSGIYPLVVVDGITVFTGSAGSAVGNDPLSDINPGDIETIDILKDASATAIYGSRAANGVLVITTKKGKKGRSKVSVDSWVSFNSTYNLPKLLNATDYVAIKNEARINAGLSPGFALQKNADSSIVNTNWYDVAYHTGVSQNENISFSGSNETTDYYFSTGYSNQNGFIRNNSYIRKIARLNIDHKLLPFLTIGANISYSNSLNKGPNTGAIPPNSITAPGGNSNNTQYIGTEPLARLTYILPPNVRALNPDGTYNINPANGTIGYGANSSALGVFNAWNEQTVIDLDKNTSENNAFIGNLSGEWTVTKGLKLKTSYGLDNLTVENKGFLNPYSGDGATARPNIIGGGSATNTYTKLTTTDWTNTLTYGFTIHEDHHLRILGGYEEIHKTINGWGAVRSGITDPYYTDYQGGWSNIASSGNVQSESGLRSFFSNLNYDYANKYLLSLNFRRDGLSALAPGNKWGNFGGGSLGWNISEEGFYKTSPLSNVINGLKLRGSYGVVGNSSIADYAALSTYSSATYEGLATLYYSQAGNPNLKWETSKKTDIGLNLGFLGNKLGLEADYFYNLTDGLILNSPIAASLGIPAGAIAANVGSLYNTGVELGISLHLVDRRKFRWDMNLNFSTLKNKVTALGNGGDIYASSLSTFGIQNITRVGYSIGSIFAVPTTGVNPANGNRVYLNQLNQLVQYNAINKSFTNMDGTTATPIDNYKDGRIMGSSLPTYFGGFNNTFSYENFDLNIGFNFSGGNKLYNGTKATLLDQRYFNNATYVKDRWTKGGQITDVPKLVYGDNFSTGFSSSNSARVEDGSYVKLKNLSLGYSVPLSEKTRAMISSIHVYIQATNVFTITKYTGSDPEISINGNSINSGKDQNVPPNARTITFGLNLGF